MNIEYKYIESVYIIIFFYLFIYLFVHLFIHLLFHLFIYLFIYLLLLIHLYICFCLLMYQHTYTYNLPPISLHDLANPKSLPLKKFGPFLREGNSTQEMGPTKIDTVASRSKKPTKNVYPPPKFNSECEFTPEKVGGSREDV